MKKIIAKRLALIIGTTMVIIMLLNLLIQRENAIEQLKNNSKLVIKQITAVLEKNEQRIDNKEDVDELVSRIPVPEGTTYYVVDKESLMIVGNIGDQQVGKSIQELVKKWAVNKVIGVGKDFYYFQEDGEYYIGVSKPKAVVLESVKDNMGQLFIYLFIAAYVMIFMSMGIIDRYVLRSVDKIVSGVKEITGGRLDTKIEVDHTPELKALSDNINQMTGSLLDQAVKISKILDAVDMLIAVYEYGRDSERVMATGKLGAILMMSEEESREMLKDKAAFEQKIDEIKQYSIEGFHKVYQLPVETECYLKIESFQNQESEFGVIMDVTEEIIDKQRLQRERDYDLLTGLLSRRAFYQKKPVGWQSPAVLYPEKFLFLSFLFVFQY